jgi:SAM-dependent methyltransferase
MDEQRRDGRGATMKRQTDEDMKTLEPNEILEHDTARRHVRERYGRIAETDGAGCGCAPSCCTPKGATDVLDHAATHDAATRSQRMGYSHADTAAVPAGANLGLGCGNPLAIASLRAGQTVLDLGSGAGFDAFLAARAVGPAGRVIGVDMTPEMVSKARANAAKSGYANVEFRLGEIENLPVADATVDVILSNCVINLAPDKPRVFREAFRALKPGGRLAISDIVALQPVPEAMRRDVELYTACAAGAALVRDVETALRDAGFAEVHVTPKPESRAVIAEWFPGRALENYFASAIIEAVKPATP